MADMSKDKKLKLANTRKRFKELQELKKKKTASSVIDTTEPNLASSSQEQVPVDCSTNTQNQLVQNVIEELPTYSLASNENSSSNLDSALANINADLPAYFGNTDSSANFSSPTDFFDNISSPTGLEKKDSNSTLLTYFDTSDQEATVDNEEQNIGLPKYFDNSSPNYNVSDMQENSNSDYTLFPRESEDSYMTKIRHITKPNDDTLCQDDPEITQNEIFQYQKENENDSNTAPEMYKSMEIFSADDTKNLLSYLDSADPSSVQDKSESNQSQGVSNTAGIMRQEVQHSNVENLRQLSDELAQMMEPNYEYSATGSITDLEKRNLELAANLEKEKLCSEQLRAANKEYQSRIAELEAKVKESSNATDLQAAQEISRLKNELQTHFRTIGLLVAEKTELSASLSQYELNFKQKTAECEELLARLRASRSRVAEFEREMNILKTEKSKIEDLGEQSCKTLENLREEYKNLKEQKDELAQDVMEAQGKLKQALEENLTLQQHNKELTNKFSLAEIKIQQLTSGSTSGVETEIERLTQEKFALEGDVANLNQRLKSIIKERDENTVQYQQYGQQLNSQVVNLSEKLDQLQKEKENLVIQEQNRVKHIGELEKQLQNLQNNEISYATRNTSNSDLMDEMESFREMCVQLKVEKSALEESHTKVCNEKELLLKELEAKNDSISQLEGMVEQLRGNQPDSVKLLATMESDKVAAARAVQQNKELKQQMESMQEVFTKLDNDKVLLTDKLSIEQQTNKDLMEKLQKTEHHLQTLADAIEIKDRELVHLRDSSEEHQRHVLQHQQLEDRLRHYEAQNNSSYALQHELQEAKHTIVKLTNEINELKNEDNKDSDKQKIEDLTKEISKLKEESLDVTNEFGAIGRPSIEDSQDRDEADSNQNMLDKEHAMKCLEDKVKRTMQEIADLSEEKQRLEHIVLQLQGETETIGEYVALYQHQRMVLKQRALEKDQQLKQLAIDREQIKFKLDRLNQLIKRLVDRGANAAELIKQQEIINGQTNVIEAVDNNEDAKSEDTRSSQTAEEIMSLLTEIKTSNLVDPDENYHHCPWCSGELITV